MERGSTHHSPRLDDAMAAETGSITTGAPVEARADEARTMEGAADGEPVPDARVGAERFEPAGGALGAGDVERRAQLAASVRPSTFPGDRRALLAAARAEHADPWVLDALAALPADARFENVQQVWVALGGAVEQRTPEPPAAPPARDAGGAPAPAPPAPVAPSGAPRPAPARPGSPVGVASKIADRALDAAVATVAIAVGVVASVGRRIRSLLP